MFSPQKGCLKEDLARVQRLGVAGTWLTHFRRRHWRLVTPCKRTHSHDHGVKPRLELANETSGRTFSGVEALIIPAEGPVSHAIRLRYSGPDIRSDFRTQTKRTVSQQSLLRTPLILDLL